VRKIGWAELVARRGEDKYAVLEQKLEDRGPPVRQT